jgi:hypothetical protein
LGREYSICQFIPLCVPVELKRLHSWHANPQRAALTPLTKYHHGLVAAALEPSQYTASTCAHHTRPAPQIINHTCSMITCYLETERELNTAAHWLVLMTFWNIKHLLKNL